MNSGPSSSSRPADVFSDEFPAGLRVIVVDDDPTWLRIVEKMLTSCLYQVTKCIRAEVALALLRGNKNGYDVVISDVHMPDMDGFKLLEHVGIEMDLPVIMMSADDSKSVVMKGVTHGACDYLIKPVRMEALKNIWQHVVRKKKHGWKDKDVERSPSVEDGEHQQKPSEDVEYLSSANEENFRGSKKRKDEEEEEEEEEETEDREDASTLKKPRVVWSVELHQQFVAAVNQLGIDKAVPKKILEMMNVPGLTRENVASHLQKYRIYLRKLSGVSGHQNGLDTSFMISSPEAAFRSMSSLSGLDLNSLAASGQLPPQSLATLQAAVFSRPATASAISMPIPDQRFFSFETPKLISVNGQQEACNSGKQVSLLQGTPTNMEPNQLANLHSAQPFWGMNGSSQVNPSNPLFMPITQLHSRGQLLNQTNFSQVPRIQSTNGQTLLSNSIPRVWTPKCVERSTASTHMSQGSSMVGFSMKQSSEFPGTSFPLLSDPGMSTLSSKPLFQGELNSDIQDPRTFHPGYNLVNELRLKQTPDWSPHNISSTFHASQHLAFQGAKDASHSVFSRQDFSSTPNSRGHNNGPVSKGFFSGGGGPNNSSSMDPVNPLLADTSIRVESKSLTDPGCQSNMFSKSISHDDDLMSALLEQQQQDDVIPVANEFGIDESS